MGGIQLYVRVREYVRASDTTPTHAQNLEIRV